MIVVGYNIQRRKALVLTAHPELYLNVLHTYGKISLVIVEWTPIKRPYVFSVSRRNLVVDDKVFLLYNEKLIKMKVVGRFEDSFEVDGPYIVDMLTPEVFVSKTKAIYGTVDGVGGSGDGIYGRDIPFEMIQSIDLFNKK